MSSAALYRLRTTLSFAGSQALFTTYWDNPSIAAGSAVATEALARVRAFWNSVAARLPSTATIAFDPVLIQLDQVTGQPLAAYSGTPPAAVAFTGSVDALPLSTQLLVRYNTGIYVRGRALVGRSFIPYLDENASVTGTGPNSGTITGFNTALGLLGTTVLTSINQVVWSRPNAAFPGSGQAEPVTSRTVSTTWAVQKGRRP